MNKTISINIAGFVFNIEEQAYELLEKYLASIKKNFKHEPDCEEIMQDIEARIAELFHERISEIKEVITEQDVMEIKSIMGQPEDFISEETEDNFNQDKKEEDDAEFVEAEDVGAEGSYRGPRRQKRLYRDEKNGTIGGVCEGLGWFFGIDPVLIRGGFIALTILGGSGVLLYIILWIVIPEAKTTAEILEMQGQPVNLGNIKDHFKGMKAKVDKNTGHVKSKIKQTVHTGRHAGSRFAQGLVKLFGLGLMISGIIALFLLIILLFGDVGLLPLVGSEQIEDFPTMLSIIYPDGRSTLVFACIMIVSLLPILGFIFAGTKLLFDIQTKFKKITIVSVIIFALGITGLSLTGVELGMSFRNHVEIDQAISLDNDSTDLLLIDVAQDDIFSDYIEYQQVWNYTELVKVKEQKIYLGYPELRVIQSKDSGNFDITLYRESNGLHHKTAIEKAERINYKLTSTGNQLTLAPYFYFDQSDKMRNQRIEVEIHVPVGKKVKFGENIDRILVDIVDHKYGHRDQHSFANTSWKASEKGIECLDCRFTDEDEENDD